MEDLPERERQILEGAGKLKDGSPAWELAQLMPGMTPEVFCSRIGFGFSPEDAAMLPVKPGEARPFVKRCQDPGYAQFCREQYLVSLLLEID